MCAHSYTYFVLVIRCQLQVAKDFFSLLSRQKFIKVKDYLLPVSIRGAWVYKIKVTINNVTSTLIDCRSYKAWHNMIGQEPIWLKQEIQREIPELIKILASKNFQLSEWQGKPTEAGSGGRGGYNLAHKSHSLHQLLKR